MLKLLTGVLADKMYEHIENEHLLPKEQKRRPENFERDYRDYRVARKCCRSFILRIGDFLCFAGTNFCGSRRLKSLVGTNFCDALVQAAE